MFAEDGRSYSGAVADIQVRQEDLCMSVAVARETWTDLVCVIRDRACTDRALEAVEGKFFLHLKRGQVLGSRIGVSASRSRRFELLCDPAVLFHFFLCGYALVDENGVSHLRPACIRTFMPFLVNCKVMCASCQRCFTNSRHVY